MIQLSIILKFSSASICVEITSCVRIINGCSKLNIFELFSQVKHSEISQLISSLSLFDFISFVI